MKHFALAMIAIVFCIGGVAGMAQTVTGAVRGTITDPSGAIVSGATVTATNTASSVATTTRTNNTGEYSIRFLQIGQYKLTVSAQGFETANYGPFALEIDQTAKVDIRAESRLDHDHGGCFRADAAHPQYGECLAGRDIH